MNVKYLESSLDQLEIVVAYIGEFPFLETQPLKVRIDRESTFTLKYDPHRKESAVEIIGCDNERNTSGDIVLTLSKEDRAGLNEGSRQTYECKGRQFILYLKPGLAV